MQRILPYYVLKELAEAFIVALAAFTVLLPIGQMVKAVQHGMPVSTTLHLAVYELPYTLSWTLPLALLTGCVTAFGRLAADNEILAMSASGVHPGKIIYPAFLSAALMVLACWHLSANVAPRCHLAQRVAKYEAALDMPIALMGPGLEQTTVEIGPVKVFFRETDNDRLYDVVMYSSNEKGDTEVIRAAEGEIRVDRRANAVTITLWRGDVCWVNPDHSFGQTTMEFDEWAREVKLQEASVRIAPGWKDRRSAELRKIVADGSYEVKDREGQPRRASLDDENRLEVLGEINRRSAMAWSPAPFALIGVPLGLITRRGKKIVGFAVSLGVVLVYYPMLVAGSALASKGVVPAWAALHGADIVIGLCGLVMTVVFVWRR